MSKVQYTPDVEVSRHGHNVYGFTPLTADARQVFDEEIRPQSEPWQWMGLTICVDHSLAAQLAQDLEAQGLVIA